MLQENTHTFLKCKPHHVILANKDHLYTADTITGSCCWPLFTSL